MDLGLRGRVALVTAASRGLGRAIAEELSAEGASLVICARNEEQLDRARSEIGARTSLPVMAIKADVSNPRDVARVIERTLDGFQRIDILVTNAGGPPSGPFESHGADAWDAAYKLTLASVLNLCRGVLPGRKERRWGRILNITSIAAKQPVDAAERVERLVGHARHALRGREIRDNGAHLGAGRARDRVACLTQARLVARADDERRALARELLRDGASESP